MSKPKLYIIEQLQELPHKNAGKWEATWWTMYPNAGEFYDFDAPEPVSLKKARVFLQIAHEHWPNVQYRLAEANRE